jgi:lipid-binding SYLF domain-containing protein
MNKLVAAMFFILILSFVTPYTLKAESGISKIDDAAEVLKNIVSIPEKSIPPALLRDASGIAIIPNVIRAGFIIGGKYGSGILVVRQKDGKWSNPSFITLTGGSIGWQIGVESIDIILVFKNERSINRIMDSKFTLGVDASVAAGPVGREVQAATDAQLKSEIYSYSRSRGLFAGLVLSGAALQVDDEANEKFYNKKYVGTREIFADKELKVPSEVNELKKLLSEYAK